MKRPGRVEVYRDTFGWYWKFYASNVLTGRSAWGYDRLRDLSHNLEQCFPGYRLLDRWGGLNGPEWFLHSMEPAEQPAGYVYLPPGLTLGVGMRGVRIPVTVPAGVWLGSRR